MTARKRRWRLIAALVVIVTAYAVWLGVKIARFSPPSAVSPAARAGTPAYEVDGVYHVHTRFSDGHAPPERIAAVAAARRLDFVILTDHGSPNRESLQCQGWKEGVLMLAGSELSVSRGHLVALDFAVPGPPFPQNAERAIQAVAAEGGFTVIAHPFSKTSWTWGEETGFQGIELADTDSMVRRNYLGILPYIPALALKSQLPLLKALSRPVEPMRKWDSLAAERPVFGYYSADVHLFYSANFDCFRLHALTEGPLARDFDRAREQVFGALRRGRFYSAVDGAATAAGFEFWAEADGERFPMGSRVEWDGTSAVKFNVRAPFAFAVETCLIRNGQVIARAAGGELSYAADRAGVYRIEVYLKQQSPLATDFPWIVSNPIFLKRS